MGSTFAAPLLVAAPTPPRRGRRRVVLAVLLGLAICVALQVVFLVEIVAVYSQPGATRLTAGRRQALTGDLAAAQDSFSKAEVSFQWALDRAESPIGTLREPSRGWGTPQRR